MWLLRIKVKTYTVHPDDLFFYCIAAYSLRKRIQLAVSRSKFNERKDQSIRIFSYLIPVNNRCSERVGYLIWRRVKNVFADYERISTLWINQKIFWWKRNSSARTRNPIRPRRRVNTNYKKYNNQPYNCLNNKI
jgi:hypothetical protein